MRMRLQILFLFLQGEFNYLKDVLFLLLRSCLFIYRTTKGNSLVKEAKEYKQ